MKYLISGDQHLRGDKPRCRTETDEEWVEFEFSQLTKIVSYANKYEATLCLTGDLFDVPHVPDAIVNKTVATLMQAKNKINMISGNHEKVYHREDNVDKSSIGIFKHLPFINYKVDNEHVDGNRFEHSATFGDITIVHTLCFENEDKVPYGIEYYTTAEKLLDKYDTKYIFTGDMHQPFVFNKDGRMVINSGKMTAQTVKEGEIPPVVYLLDTDTDEITTLPLDNPKVSREHIAEKEAMNKRIKLAMMALKDNKNVSLSFIDNLKKELPKMSKEINDVVAELEEQLQEDD